jgi:hypothetical protein
MIVFPALSPNQPTYRASPVGTTAPLDTEVELPVPELAATVEEDPSISNAAAFI